MLHGHPRLGGFGCQPWHQHILSGHAVWGCRLVRALAAGLHPQSPLWLAVAKELLVRLGRTSFGPAASPVQPAVPPALALLSASRDPVSFRIATNAHSLPHGPLRRMALGLRALTLAAGPLAAHAAAPLAPGPWCLAAPLWGNPMLPAPVGVAGVGGSGSCMEDVFGDLQVVPPLRTIGDAVRILSSLHAAWADCALHGLLGDARRQRLGERVWWPELRRAGWDLPLMPCNMTILLADSSRAILLLTRLLAALPPTWLAHCPLGTLPMPDPLAAGRIPLALSVTCCYQSSP